MATILDTSLDSLVASALNVLSGLGYNFNRSTTSLNSYLATVLAGVGGSSSGQLNLSRAQLLAGIVNGLSIATVSHLTSGEATLWALIAGYSGSPDSPPIGVALKSDFSSPSNEPWVFW